MSSFYPYFTYYLLIYEPVFESCALQVLAVNSSYQVPAAASEERKFNFLEIQVILQTDLKNQSKAQSQLQAARAPIMSPAVLTPSSQESIKVSLRGTIALILTVVLLFSGISRTIITYIKIEFCKHLLPFLLIKLNLLGHKKG